jgi:hypothetical protein
LRDLREQFDLAIAIRDKVSEANNAVIKIRDLKKQTEERLKQSSDAGLKAVADSFTTHLSEVEESIYQVRNPEWAGSAQLSDQGQQPAGKLRSK